MQEQTPSNITPEQGWTQMRSILDREMPQERRSRRIIFFWWTLAAVVFLSASGYLLWNTNTLSNTQHESTTPVQDGPANPAPVTSVNPGFAVQDDQVKSEESSQSSQPVVTRSGAIESGEEAITRKAESSKLKKGETKNVFAATETEGQKQSVLSALKATSGSPDQVEETADQNTTILSSNQIAQTPALASAIADGNHAQSINSADQDAIKAVRNGQIIFALPCLVFSALEIPDAEIGAIAAAPNRQVKTVSNTTRIKVNPFASTAALAGWNGGGGMNAAAGLNAKVKPRLAMQAGIGYGTFDPRLSFIKGDQMTAEDLVGNGGIVQNDNSYPEYENYIVGESLSTGNTYTALNPIVEHLNRWQGELGLSYDLSRRWFAQGGVHVSFNTRAYSQYPIINADINSIPTEVRASHSLDSYDVIRNTMTSVYGGIGYHIGKHFDLYGQVVYGFQPYLLTTELTGIGAGIDPKDREDYIRGVSLGLRYSL